MARYNGFLGQPKHVGAFGVFGAAVVGWQGAVGVYFSFEAAEEGFAGGAGAGAAVGGPAPGDLGRDLAVEVLSSYGRHLPSGRRRVVVSTFVSERLSARLRADARGT
jgi:hypothetical protein